MGHNSMGHATPLFLPQSNCTPFYHEPELLPSSKTNLLPRLPTFPSSTPTDVNTNESLGTQLHKNTQQPNSKPFQNTERIPHITTNDHRKASLGSVH